jgi:hypothetical protein
MHTQIGVEIHHRFTVPGEGQTLIFECTLRISDGEEELKSATALVSLHVMRMPGETEKDDTATQTHRHTDTQACLPMRHGVADTTPGGSKQNTAGGNHTRGLMKMGVRRLGWGGNNNDKYIHK